MKQFSGKQTRRIDRYGAHYSRRQRSSGAGVSGQNERELHTHVHQQEHSPSKSRSTSERSSGSSSIMNAYCSAGETQHLEHVLNGLLQFIPEIRWLYCRQCHALMCDPVAMFVPQAGPSRDVMQNDPCDGEKNPNWELLTTDKCPASETIDSWEDYVEAGTEECYQVEDIGNGHTRGASTGLLRHYCQKCAETIGYHRRAGSSPAQPPSDVSQHLIPWTDRATDITLTRLIDCVEAMAKEQANCMLGRDHTTATATSPTDAEIDQSRKEILTRWHTRLSEEFKCAICHSLLYRPTITPCGHTFCRNCLERGYDHKQECPTCRAALPGSVTLFTRGRHHLLDLLLQRWLAEAYWQHVEYQRENEVTEHWLDYTEHPQGAVIPIFVCTLVFPGMPCYLHIFEPRYRLLIRRCWIGSRRFGMVCGRPAPSARDTSQYTTSQLPYMEHGTVLLIEHLRILPDGRMLVLARGERRFQVVQDRPKLDGYHMAKVEWIDDLDVDNSWPSTTATSLDSNTTPACADTVDNQIHGDAISMGNFIRAAAAAAAAPNYTYHNDALVHLRAQASQPQSLYHTHIPLPFDTTRLDTLDLNRLSCVVRQRLMYYRHSADEKQRNRIDKTYGPMPDEPQAMSYWCASIVPLDRHLRYRALELRSVRQRLLLTSSWLDALDNRQQHWWLSDTCTIM